MDNLINEEKTANEKPTPRDFDVFLPWACAELRIDANVVIIKIKSLEKSNLGGAKLKKGKSKHEVIKSKHELADSDQDSSKSLDYYKDLPQSEKTVTICAVYDILGNLLQLKFDKNQKIPNQIIKLIGLIINYHKFMTSITANSGVNNECLYEIKNLLMLANITDVCLDNTAVRDGHYDLLLQDSNNLKHLSMSRCKIDDATVNRIAINLRHPLPASKTLLVLNLTSNSITDIGATYLALALRTNRKLVYLNLADNAITDEGAGQIFNTLTVFLVTDEELMSFRHRKVKFIEERNCLINQIGRELKCADFDRRYSKKKPIKPVVVPPSISSKKGYEKDLLKDAIDRSIQDLETLWLEKAKIKADEQMLQFEEPFSAKHVYVNDAQMYCFGNNNLAYINISYNHVGYITVKKILAVLLKQQSQNRKPKGLLNVCLEGNFIPSRCRELEEIDFILISNLSTGKKSSQTKVKK